VRLLFDEGSQRSSITSSLVKELKSRPVGEELSRDVLADGSVTPFRKTFRHNVTITGIDGEGEMKIILREKIKLGEGIPRVPAGLLAERLKKHGICISDLSTNYVKRSDIDIIIGSDYEALVKSGARVDLGSGLAAWGTRFGWTISGPVSESQGITSIDMFCAQQDISML
jgi:hypothetical protein